MKKTMYLLLLVVSLKSVLSQTNFILHTEECKIPYFPAFNEEVNATLVPTEYTSCTDSDILTFTQIANNTAYLHLNEENEIFHKSEEPLTCCYSYVIRNGTEEEPDVGISISDCIPFNKTVKLEEEVVKVKCEDKDGNLIYENVHNPITISKSVEKKLETSTRHKKISILVIVIDSISRQNFRRTMPLTRKTLLENHFSDFKIYNKVDDNTFPNCMALLTGMNYKQVYSACNPREVGTLDKCPIIWYNFRDLGYATAYAEDWVNISTFNYLKKGFVNPPTDYYFKPYMEAAETLNVTIKNTMPYCTGPETEGERILNLAKDFAITFKNKPSFGVFWMNTFSHNDISAPMGMDEKVSGFFQELNEYGILEDSIVMLLSDHGIRFAKIRESIQGWFEDRLPANFISLPPWFRRKYQLKYNLFLDNVNKLVSTYDLYMTLQDVLKMSVASYNPTPSLACPTCQSLFSNITRNRSCREAGIPEAWCSCVGEFVTEDVRITEEAKAKASELSLREIKKLEGTEPISNSINNIILAAVNLNRLRKSYLLLVVETDSKAIYQIMFRIRGDPIDFVRIVRISRLY